MTRREAIEALKYLISGECTDTQMDYVDEIEFAIADMKICSDVSADDDIAYDYNEEEDEYYLKEGWYECINNWDEYSSIVIGDFVTHWQNLPEPPKEEAEYDD